MKILYFALSYTWGIIMILVGYVVRLVLRIMCVEYEMHGPCRVYQIGKTRWGGVSLGHTILTQKDPSRHTLNHEFGHSIQNAVFGPFYLLIALVSAMRYHRRKILKKKNPNIELPLYDSVWYEGTATKWGNKSIKYFK